MAQYIDKSALIAEIERRIKKYATIDVGNSSELDALYGAKCHVLMSILSFLNTLEVKEIGFDLGSPNGDIGAKTIWDKNKIVSVSEPSSNLEEEINAYMDNEMKFLSDEIGYDTFSTIAKYFFELGLKAKGE